MNRLSNYELIDAVRTFQRALRNATEAELDEAFQRVATEANGSEWAQTHEPLQGVAVAFVAEQKQRLHRAGSR